MQKAQTMVVAVLFGFAAFAAAARAEPVAFSHIHGLAYDASGALMVASHEGLVAFENGRWARRPGRRHDYLGFAATARGLYSSGYAEAGSKATGPLGVIRSRDGGRSWNELGLAREAQFTLLAASWNASAVYLWSPEPNVHMRQPGLHRTFNDGRAWEVAEAMGLEGEPSALAAHPEARRLVTVATSKGVFESVDAGKSFTQLTGVAGSAVFYDLDGKHLWYAVHDGRRARLARARLRAGPMMWMALPPLEQEAAVIGIAQSPAMRTEYAIATPANSVYASKDGARSWSRIAERGAPVNER